MILGCKGFKNESVCELILIAVEKLRMKIHQYYHALYL